MDKTRKEGSNLAVEQDAHPSRGTRGHSSRPEHFVQFYEGDEFLTNSVAKFIGGGLGAGESAIVIATDEHRRAIERRLSEQGIDLRTVQSRCQLVLLDAAETLTLFMRDGAPDEQRFMHVLGKVLKQTQHNGGAGLRAFGEMVALLWAEGNGEAAIRLEELWNKLAEKHTFTLFCAYPINGFKGASQSADFSRLCKAHSRVEPTEAFVGAPSDAERMRLIAELQQKALSLENEIEQRQRAEEALRKSEANLQTELADAKLLQSVSSAIVFQPNMEALYEKLVDAAVAIMRSDFASMQMFHPERGNGELRLLALRGFEPQAAETWAWVSRDSPSSCGEALRRRGRVIAADIEQCDFLGVDGLAAYRAAGIGSMQSTPLFSRTGELVGVISTHWRRPHTPTERELRLFDILARQAADVIEQKRADMLLRDTNERLTKVLEVETVGVMIWDLNAGCLVDANDTFLKMMGYSRSDVEARTLTWEKFTPPEYQKISREEIRKFQETGRVGPYEKQYFRKDGTRQWLLFAGSSMGNNRCVEFCIDIEGRKEIERALRDTQAQLVEDSEALRRLNDLGSRLWQSSNLRESINEMLAATIAMLGADFGNIQLLEGCTLRIAAQHGFKAEFLEFFREVSSDDDSACGRALRTGERIIIEDVETDEAYASMRDIARSAGYRGVQSTPFIGRDGKPRGMISTHWRSPHRPNERQLRQLDLYVRQAADFIERWEMEQALRESEQQFRATFENAAVGIAHLGLDGRWLRFNDAICEITGYSPEELRGKTFTDITHPAEIEKDWQQAKRLMAGEIPRYSMEKRYFRKDGSPVWVMLTVSLMRDAAGAPKYFISVIENISDRKRAHESSARLAAIVESSDDAIVSKDLSGIITSWNKGAERIFGYTAGEMIGKPITILIPPDRANEEPAILARIRRGERVEHFQTVRQRKDGTLLDISLTISPIKDAGGNVIGASKIARDITELVRAREKLEETVAERTAQLRDTVAELEAFSYSVAHDMRAPLRAMNSYSRFLQEDFAEALPQQGRDYARRIGAGAERLDALIRDVLNYSKISRGELHLEKVDVEKLAREIIDSYPDLRDSGAAILVQSPIPAVLANAAALTQCISNLLSNGVKFVAPGGTPRVIIRSERSGDFVRLWFEDNGIGISDEGKKRIFHMFQRLNATSDFEGTGIGLTIVRKAVERMGGKLGVVSQPGAGSQFWIELKHAT